jgi:hypothetical protein
MLPPVVARPIRNDDSTEKIPRAMGDFFARARDSISMLAVCGGYCFRRVSRSLFVGYLGRLG